MMDIYDRIVENIVDFEGLTGERPSAVYVGKEELIELKKVRAYYVLATKVHGIKVYKVNEKNHLGSGIVR